MSQKLKQDRSKKNRQTDLVVESEVFREILKKTGQAQDEGGELKPGATHTLKKTVDGKEVLVRRRFSAI